MFQSASIGPAPVAAITAIIASVLSAVIAAMLQRAKTQSDLLSQEARLKGELENRLRSDLRTEFMAEEAIQQLLRVEKWNRRSFEQISKHIGGFEGNELRRLLVRSGAVRFTKSTEPKEEMWGLRVRNHNYLNVEEPEIPH